MDAFGLVTFALVIYLICVSPTKKDLARLLKDDERKKTQRLHDAIGRYIDRRCSITLTEAMICAGSGLVVTGVVRDLDERYALFEVEQKRGESRLIALRLDMIAGISEQE